ACCPVLTDSLHRRGESVVVNGCPPPLVDSGLANLPDFLKSVGDRVVKVLGRQGPAIVRGFCGEPLASTLLPAAVTGRVEFIEVPILSVDRAPVTVAHRDENALGSLDEIRRSQLLPRTSVANRRVGVLQQYLLEFLVVEPCQARGWRHIPLSERIRAARAGLTTGVPLSD